MRALVLGAETPAGRALAAALVAAGARIALVAAGAGAGAPAPARARRPPRLPSPAGPRACPVPAGPRACPGHTPLNATASACKLRLPAERDEKEAQPMTVLDKLRLDGKTAVVTGAGRGLGRAMALALAEAGCDIVAAARTRPQIEETAELVRALRQSAGQAPGHRGLVAPPDI